MQQFGGWNILQRMPSSQEPGQMSSEDLNWGRWEYDNGVPVWVPQPRPNDPGGWETYSR